MGIGITVIFWIIILIFISLILAPFVKKNGFFRAFKKIFIALVVFVSIFLLLNKTINYFIGKRIGGFGDAGYYEILNGYTFKWIDDMDNGQLVYGDKVIATNVKSFSETFKLVIKNDLLILNQSIKPNQVIVIDTIKKVEEEKPKKWLLENNISENNLKTLYSYREEESAKIENILPVIMSFLIALMGGYFFIRKDYQKVDK